MKSQKLLLLAMIAALVAAVVPIPAAAAPEAQATNLLTNGGFETGFGSETGTGWAKWWLETAKPGDGSANYAYLPKWNVESLYGSAAAATIYAGNNSQRIINSWDPWYAGVKQTVTAPAGAKVRLTVYARLWASSDNWPAPSDSSSAGKVQVGIEPNGTDNQFAGSVVWSSAMAPHNAWQPVSVEATVGASGKVTAILSGDYRGSSRLFQAVYFDEASLVVVSGGTAAPGATAVPTPTAPPCYPAPFQMPTPQPDGTVIYIVKSCDSLWSIAANVGITLEQIKALNGLTSNVITPGQRLIIKQGVPTATPEQSVQPTATPVSTQIAGTTTGVGTLCVLLYNDTNGNGVREANETLLAGGQFTIVDTATGAPVQAYTTTGVGEPHCFENLPAGNYTISSAAPANYNSTGKSASPLTVEAGSLYNIEFGAQPSGAASGGGGSADNNQRLRTAIFGAAGIMFLLLAAGIAGFLVLRRPR